MSPEVPPSRKRPGAWHGGVASALIRAALLFGAVELPAGEGVPDPAVIQIDLGRLDAAGLQGPPDGRRSLDYEYCIPAGAVYGAEVAAIDPSARFLPGSRGRIGCRSDRVLVLGNTHQPGFREVLEALAGLPFVERIIECSFE